MFVEGPKGDLYSIDEDLRKMARGLIDEFSGTLDFIELEVTGSRSSGATSFSKTDIQSNP